MIYSQNSRRALLVLTGAFALTFAVSRCGPITPSIAKRSLGNGLTDSLVRTDTSSGVGPSTSIEKEEVLVAKPELISALSGAKELTAISEIENTAAPESGMNEIHTQIKGTQLSEFRDLGKLGIALPGGRGFLHVHAKMKFNLSLAEMKAQQLDQLELVFQRKSDQSGILQLKSTSPEALKAVQNSLTELVFTAGLQSMRQGTEKSQRAEALTTIEKE